MHTLQEYINSRADEGEEEELAEGTVILYDQQLKSFAHTIYGATT